jgi:N-acetyl-gamma-glutamyl-phosphate reductase
MKKVFIDGSYGTTGLRIHERLSERKDIELLQIAYGDRHDETKRKEALNQADLVFLCLPDAASEEAVQLVENPDTVIIDTATVHRVQPGWTYGMPELKGQKEKIRQAKRIANPGCHASGFILLTAPLVQAGLLPKNAVLSLTSLTGYSGGGKKMIQRYEDPDRDPSCRAPQLYGLTQSHKHLPEMTKMTGLVNPPVFNPVVADYYSGMESIVSLSVHQLNGTKEDVVHVYQEYYPHGMVHYEESLDDNGYLKADGYAGYDDMGITVIGNDERMDLIALFDNLGKGAGGSAIQNMNLVLGYEEETGLVKKK